MIEERVDGLVERDQRAHRNVDSPRDPFRMLMRGRAGYGPDLAGETLAPSHKDLVSLPGDLGALPSIADLPDGDDRLVVEVAGEPLLRSGPAAAAALQGAPPRGFCVAGLVRYRRHCASFVRRLDGLGLFRWRCEVKESVGVFSCTGRTARARAELSGA